MNDTTLTLDQELQQAEIAFAQRRQRAAEDMARIQADYERQYMMELEDHLLERRRKLEDDYTANPHSWSYLKAWRIDDWKGHEREMLDEIASIADSRSRMNTGYHCITVNQTREGYNDEFVVMFCKAVSNE